jgi:hypothetical protein
VADLGIAHLARRQADMKLRGLQQRRRRDAGQRVHRRRMRRADGVVGRRSVAMAPAIEHHQHHGPARGNGHEIAVHRRSILHRPPHPVKGRRGSAEGV